MCPSIHNVFVDSHTYSSFEIILSRSKLNNVVMYIIANTKLITKKSQEKEKKKNQLPEWVLENSIMEYTEKQCSRWLIER